MQKPNILSENHLSEYRKRVFAFITLAIIILSIYSNTFHASWQFDDTHNILNRQEIHLNELSWSQVEKILFKDTERLNRPVSRLSLAINYYFGQTEVFGYHLVNISIHFVTSFFLFLFIYHTLSLPLINTKYAQNSYFIALLSTTLWVINPIQTQAVTYIVQRMTSMAAMFYIMSMYFYLKARTSKKGSEITLHFIMCIVCGILAISSKENAALLPIVILVLDLG